ncbi:hypothetical protein [Brevundimonas sp.]|uniref:hypothetical protein n=1 Tax=Brevundimonas sp. TaxID=1871086 RepID=UPI003F72F056
MDWVALGVVVAAIAGGVPAILWWIDHRNAAGKDPELSIESIDWVLEQGMTYEELLRGLISLDRAALAGLTDITGGTAEVKADVFEKSPETWALVVFKNSMIVGYWSCFSLSQKLLDRLNKGEMYDSEITESEVRPLSEKAPHSLYFEMIGIHPGFQWCRKQIFRKILDSLSDFATSLPAQGIKVDAIYANGFSEVGADLCTSLGLSPLVESVQGGQIYRSADVRAVTRQVQRRALRRRLASIEPR